jgi:hypothetical protein
LFNLFIAAFLIFAGGLLYYLITPPVGVEANQQTVHFSSQKKEKRIAPPTQMSDRIPS